MEFQQTYDPEKDRVWVVEKEHQMVGFLLLCHRPENQAQLRFFILDQSWRGLGIGRQLMNEWMSFFQEKKYKSAYLFTTSGLDAAVSLYTDHGFVKVSEESTLNYGFPMLEIYFRLEKK
ncbi:GNAT family N-acetyltransferase [Algoriphagus aestuarii]|nr:GNAT family N-acetyltransferase [Algoriphagus aestuarii]